MDNKDFDTIFEDTAQGGAKWQKKRDNIPQELIDAYWEFQKVGGDSVRVVINAINAIKEKKYESRT